VSDEEPQRVPVDVAAEIARPLAFAEEQRLLGVGGGVRILRDPRAMRAHAPSLDAHAAALRAGAIDPTLLLDERLARLRARLARIPSWHARLAAVGGSPHDLRRVEDLEHFPTMSRDELARDFAALYDHDGEPGLHVAVSSGSTGQALLVVRSGYDGFHMWAVIRFFVEHLGVVLPPRPRVALLCALPGGLEYSVRAPWLGEGGALHRISTVRPRALERLRRIRPSVLSSDPAGLHWLAGQDVPLDEARLVLSSAQHFPPSLRARFAGAINYYATTEAGPIAWECLREAGRFHVLHPDVRVESIHGELAVTRLRDSPLPLVRYLTGDRGEILDGACSCGVTGRSVIGFGGRRACAFLRADGREIDAWALSWLFKDVPLVRFQLAQLGARRFSLWLDEPAPIEWDLLAIRIGRALARLGFEAPTVERGARPRAAAKPEPFVARWP
jgi:phenylacetate-CoA ligase